MPSAKGRKRKGEKKVNTKVSQEALCENLSAGVQPTNMNEEHLVDVLRSFFPGHSFSEPFIQMLLAMQESSNDYEEGFNQTRKMMVISIPPFSLAALFCCQEIMHSVLFKELGKRAHGKNTKALTFNAVGLPAKHKFYLCHLKQNKSGTSLKTRTGMLSKERKKNSKLVNSSFDYLVLDDKEAIDKAFDQGKAIYIIGFGKQPAAHQIIAVVMYVMSSEGNLH